MKEASPAVLAFDSVRCIYELYQPKLEKTAVGYDKSHFNFGSCLKEGLAIDNFANITEKSVGQKMAILADVVFRAIL